MKILNILCSLVLMFSLAALGTYNYHRYTTMSDEGPVIMMDSDTIEVSVKDDPSVLLEGVMAYDKEDGDLTSKITDLIFQNIGRNYRIYFAYKFLKLAHYIYYNPEVNLNLT